MKPDQSQDNQEQASTKMPPIAKALIGALLLCLSTGCFILWDYSFNNGYYYNRTAYGSDCAYHVPQGYSIYYSSDRKRYAVKVQEYENYYLYNGRRGITEMFSTIAEPSLFQDSCEAKAYLKAYLYNKRNRFK